MTKAEEQFCRDLHAKVLRLAQILAHKSGGVKIAHVPEFTTVKDGTTFFEGVCQIASERFDIPLSLPWCEFLHQCEHARGRAKGNIIWFDGRDDLAKTLNAR